MTARRADLLIASVLACAVLGPLLLGSGYWLVGDMVFVPEQPWKGAWLGLDGALPRAVPMDALVSVLTHVVPGWVVQRLFLLAGLVLGGLGIARLVAHQAWYARAAAIVLFVWNPWVHDRLQIGQWAILCGYLALPWVALAARRFRADPRTGWAPAAVALVVSAVCSPSSGLMAVLVLAVLGLRRSWTSWLVLGALAVVANLPWVVPSLLAGSSTVTTDGVFALFAPRAESSLGVLPSLLSLGGTWKSSIVAGERTSVVVMLLAGAVSVAALLGAWYAGRTARGGQAGRTGRTGRTGPAGSSGPAGEINRLAALALLALLVAAVPALGGAEAGAWLGDRVPGLALVRDAQRFLAPAALLLAVGLASAVTWVRAQAGPGRESAWAVLGLLVVAPVLLLPSLAWGAGDLETSSYPADWEVVADRIAAEPEAVTIVLPWAGSYRRFDWAADRAVLDPAPRLLPGEVLIDDRTYVDGTEIASEDPRVRQVQAALDEGSATASAAALRNLGVRWVLVERGQGAPRLPAGRVVHAGADLLLIDLGDDYSRVALSGTASHRTGGVGLVIAGHVCALLLLTRAAGSILLPGSNRRHR